MKQSCYTVSFFLSFLLSFFLSLYQVAKNKLYTRNRIQNYHFSGDKKTAVLKEKRQQKLNRQPGRFRQRGCFGSTHISYKSQNEAMASRKC